MPTITEGKLSYTFSDTWNVTKYDDWVFYRRQFERSCCGNKAVDFLAYNPGDRTLWLIELKDYRQYRRKKEILLWEEMAVKARDTLAGLFAAKVDVVLSDEQRYAAQVLCTIKLRVVLHLEQPATNSKLFPRVYNPADVQQKLKQILKPIDAHPRVVELNNMDAVPWSAASIP